MKRCLIFFFLFFLFFSFASCSKKENFLPNSFSGEVSLTSAEGEYKGFLSFNEGESEFNFTYPETLKGGRAFSEGDENKLSYCGIELTLSESSPLGLLSEILKDLFSNNVEIKSKGTEKISGEINDINYVVLIDCEAKKIKEISSDEKLYIFT